MSDPFLVIGAFLAAWPAAWCVHRMVVHIPPWIATPGPESDTPRVMEVELKSDDLAAALNNQGMPAAPVWSPSNPRHLSAWVCLFLGTLFACSAMKWGASLSTATSMLLISILTTLSWIDIRTGLLPDVLTKSGAAIALIIHAWYGSLPFTSAVIGLSVGYLSLWVFFQLYRLATKKDGMGYGDFKLFAMIGAWLGWESLAPVLLVASLAALVVAIMGVIMRRLSLQSSMPFGPYLAFGGILSLFEWI